MAELIRPATAYKTSVIAAMREFAADSHHRYANTDIDALKGHFTAYVESELQRATAPPQPGWVSDSVYWLVDERGFIGRISLRHRLTDSLREFGGHIGYEVRPSRRREGHGKRMLALLLEKARARNMGKVMLTCDESNTGSRKIIEANGGELQDVIELDYRPEPTMRWWIDLKA
jgi:predicted acetyltransferase